MIDVSRYQTGQCNIAIVGLSKNAGKTTFLNWFLKQVKIPKIAVTTTGRDGEDIDLVTGYKKPKVFLPSNVLFTTFDSVLDQNATRLKALQKLPFRVIGRHIWLCETMADIQTEIIGPVTRREQEDLGLMFRQNGCEMILIDGSIDRKSICLSGSISDIALVIGASAGNLTQIKEQAEKLQLYTRFIQIDTADSEYVSTDFGVTTIRSVFGNESAINDLFNQKPEWIYFPGAITDQSWEKCRNSFYHTPSKIIVNHPINLNIKPSEIKRFLNNKPLYTRSHFPLKIVAVNSFSPNNEHIDREVLLSTVQNIFTDIDVIDVTKPVLKLL
ncbi:MAG: hypothetical protein FWG20_03355 [Candidatus Cloacimonetes bacterium]|nr:hypothetical protein [Candidatus Cloacimonadota bacterium]